MNTYSPILEYLNITPEKEVVEYVAHTTYNEFQFRDTTQNVRTCFKKFIPLVDYVKFLIGKYKSEDIMVLPDKTVDLSNTSLYNTYINSPHNYAYVDSFFYYITSKLRKEGFVHGIELYDSYICIKKDFQVDVADDFEYIGDSNYFNDKLNQLFHFKDETISTMFKKDGLGLESIHISDQIVQLDFETLDEPEPELKPESKDESKDKTEDDENKIDTIETDADEEERLSDSDISVTESEDEQEVSSDGSHESEYTDTDGSDSQMSDTVESSLEELILVIKEIPAQVISI